MTIKIIIEGLENLKCINGAMYFGAVEFPCEGRETGECCKNEQTYKEAIDELHTYLQSQLDTFMSCIPEKVEEKEAKFKDDKNGLLSEGYTIGYNEAIKHLLQNLKNKGIV